MTSPSILKSRPAETGGLTAAVAVLIAYFAGVDNPGIIAALVIVVGALPAVITWFVELMRNKKPPPPPPVVEETIAATTDAPVMKTRAMPKKRRRKPKS